MKHVIRLAFWSFFAIPLFIDNETLVNMVWFASIIYAFLAFITLFGGKQVFENLGRKMSSRNKVSFIVTHVLVSLLIASNGGLWFIPAVIITICAIIYIVRVNEGV